jgi:crossover junction endodeoxyribonuclease RuvC
MRIMGVDPGLNCTGYGLVDHSPAGTTLVEGGIIRTDPKASLEVRVATLFRGIAAVIADLDPEVMVVEQLYSTYAHPQTAILMGHARGVVLLAAAQRGLQVSAYPASLVKRALVGHGRASKQQVAQMVVRMLNLPQVPRPEDVTDALALCLCHTTPMRRDAQPGELPPRIAAALEQSAPGSGAQRQTKTRRRPT